MEEDTDLPGSLLCSLLHCSKFPAQRVNFLSLHYYVMYPFREHIGLPALTLPDVVLHLGPEGSGGTVNSRCEVVWLGFRGVIKGDDPALPPTQESLETLWSER